MDITANLTPNYKRKRILSKDSQNIDGTLALYLSKGDNSSFQIEFKGMNETTSHFLLLI
jgi:hypothetical protein